MMELVDIKNCVLCQ